MWASTCNIPWEDVAATAPSAKLHDHRSVLHRQVSGDQRGVQEVPGRRRIIIRPDDHNFLRDWKNGAVSGGMGEASR